MKPSVNTAKIVTKLVAMNALVATASGEKKMKTMYIEHVTIPRAKQILEINLTAYHNLKLYATQFGCKFPTDIKLKISLFLLKNVYSNT